MKKRRKLKRPITAFPLKEILERKGVSQNNLAKRAGIGQNRINAIANGRVCPKWDTILRIATALDCDLGELRPGFRMGA